VDVYFHWATLVVGAAILIRILLRSLSQLSVAVVALAGYFAVLLVHEWGHVVVARRRRCVAWSIEIYPVGGLTRTSTPASYFDECVIAWGGILAQLAVAAPIVVWVAVFGYTTSERANALLGALGYGSAFVALLNLLPMRPFDGARAWSLIPMLIARAIGGHLERRPQQQRRARGRKKTQVH
jgi:Zn-dependent protease